MSAASIYSERHQHASAERDRLHRSWSLLGNIRLAVAILIAVGVWQWWNDHTGTWAIAIAIAALAYFVLAVRQRSTRVQRDAAAALAEVNLRGIDRLELSWDALPLPPDSGADRHHPYAYDLNIIGKASVAQRIGTPVTHHGWLALYASLLEDRDVCDVPSRQEAVTELSAEIELRQRIEALGTTDEDVPDPTPLLRWAQSTPWLASRRWLQVWALIGPIAVVVCVALWALGFASWALVLIPLLLNGLVFFGLGAPAAQHVQQISPLRGAIESYAHVITSVAAAEPRAPLLQRIDESLHGTSLHRLRTLANLSIPAGSVLYFPMQLTLMWDVNVLAMLERWQTENGTKLPGWLDAMGEWEALAALSVLRHDHPEWCLPTIDTSAQGFDAAALAHPLLGADIAVANDVTIAPAGTFLFVTGSNMSGKSTLLRAIGVNTVLAQAGAPASAQALTMPPLRVASCMRVEDSLEHGVSFFMAELKRLKAVIDRVQATDGRMALYLLDEILQGTNTAERQIASRQVLGQLTRANAIGAVSSHDLELIDANLEPVAQLVHFREQFSRDADGETMTFDYRLRPGLATSSNAIRLMELLGFDIHD